MRDRRFYDVHGPHPLAVLVKATGARLVQGPPDQCITDVASLGAAGPEDATFAINKRALASAGHTRAGLCFCPQSLVPDVAACGAHGIAVSDNPQAAFARAALLLVAPKKLDTAGPWVSGDADIADGARIDAAARIGAGVRIGAGTWVGPFATLEPGCAVGRNCRIGAGASIAFSVIGEGVDIRPGAVIGQAGLGVLQTAQGNRPMPHFGIVRIGDDVRIGANTCVDRAVFDETVIGARTQIDNQVQIAHNVRIGEDCVLAGMCGISGGVVIGDRVMMGGRAGVCDHVQVGNDARVGAAAAVMKDIPDGQTWSGNPARPLRQYLREQLILRDLAAKTRNKDEGDD